MTHHAAVCRRPRLTPRGLVRALTALLAAGSLVAATATEGRAADGDPIRCRAGYVGLTFDDGPTAKYTPALLAALRENGIRATLFNIGENAQDNEAMVEAQKDAGMWIGNHSWSHPNLTQLPEEEVEEEIARTQATLKHITGIAPTLFRPPFGATNDTVKAVAARLGLTQILWDIDTQDWTGRPAEEIVAEAVAVKPGGIVLMHDGYPATIEAIPYIAENLRSRRLCPGMISPITGRPFPPPPVSP